MNSTLSMEQFYTEPFLHTNLHAQKHWHTNKFYPRCCKQTLLHTNAWAHKFLTCTIFYATHMGFSRPKVIYLIFKAGVFIHKPFFCTNNVTHTHGHFVKFRAHTEIFTRKRVSREALTTKRFFCTRAFSLPFSHRRCYIRNISRQTNSTQTI